MNRSEAHAKVIKEIRNKVKKSEEQLPIASDSKLSDLGLDSLDMSDMLMEIEDNFGISVSDDESQKMKTVKDVVDVVCSKIALDPDSPQPTVEAPATVPVA